MTAEKMRLVKLPEMHELHCKEECELLLQHVAIISSVIVDGRGYSLFFFI